MEKDELIAMRKYTYQYFIIASAVLVYSNMLFNGFVWDDNSYIINNPQEHTLNLISLFGWNLFNSIGQYRPIPAVYFAVLYMLFGNNSFFYHLFSLLLHIVVTLLIFHIFQTFFNKRISLFLSLLFLVHPMQVESVSYIAAAPNLMSAFFGLLALKVGIREEMGGKRLVATSFFLLLSVMTKESGILFIFILLMYSVFFKKKNFRIFLLAEFVVLGIYAVIRFFIGNVYFAKLQLIPIARLSFPKRLLNIPAVVFYYIKTFFYPAWLSIDQQWVVKNSNFWTFQAPLILDTVFFGLLVLSGIYIRRHARKQFMQFSFFFLWFLIGMGLYSQIIPLDGTVADRWFYFPIVGLLGMLGFGLSSLVARYPNYHKAFLVLGTGIILFLSARTLVRNTNWKDALTLYRHDSNISTNFDLENNLALEFTREQKYNQAIFHLQKSIAFERVETNYYNLGYAYEQTGEIQKAKQSFMEALQSPSEKSSYATVHSHNIAIYIQLARLLVIYDKPKTAVTFITSSLEDYPDSFQLWIYLALSFYKEHRQQEALSAATMAKKLSQTTETEYLYKQVVGKQPVTVDLGNSQVQIN